MQGLDNNATGLHYTDLIKPTDDDRFSSPANGCYDAIINYLNKCNAKLIRIPFFPMYGLQYAATDGASGMQSGSIIADSQGVGFFQPWNIVEAYNTQSYQALNPKQPLFVTGKGYGSSSAESDLRRLRAGGGFCGPNYFVPPSGWDRTTVSTYNSGNLLQSIYKCMKNGQNVIIDFHSNQSNIMGLYDYTINGKTYTINPTTTTDNLGFIYLWLTTFLIINNKWTQTNWCLAFQQFFPDQNSELLNNTGYSIFNGQYATDPNILVYHPDYDNYYDPTKVYLEFHNEPKNANNVNITNETWANYSIKFINVIKTAETALNLKSHKFLISSYNNYSGLHNYTNEDYGLSVLLTELQKNKYYNSADSGVYFSVHQYCDSDYSGTGPGLSDEKFYDASWNEWITTLKGKLHQQSENLPIDFKILFTEGNVGLTIECGGTISRWGDFLNDLVASKICSGITLWSAEAFAYKYNGSNASLTMFPGFVFLDSSDNIITNSSSYKYTLNINPNTIDDVGEVIIYPAAPDVSFDASNTAIWYNNYYDVSTKAEGCYTFYKINDNNNDNDTSIFNYSLGNSMGQPAAENIIGYDFTSIDTLILKK